MFKRENRIMTITLTLGVILIIVALVLKFAIVPGMKQWPDDVDTTRYYEGTMHTMLNAEALATMDLANIFMKDIPVDISRHYTTEETKGNKAIVREIIVLSGPGGQPIQSTDKYYAIDRKDLGGIPNFDDDYDIPDREGLAFNFPIGTQKKDYERWVSDMQTSAPLTYEGEEEHSGLTTYIFKSEIPGGEIVDPEVLAILPPELPKSLIAMLAGILNLPDDKKAALEAILPALPDQVPLSYVYGYEATYWIEPTTGMNIDVERHETRSVALKMGDQIVPLTPVFDLEYAATEASIEEAADDAREIKDQIDLWENIIPNTLIGLGIVLAIFSIFLNFLRRRQAAQPAS